MTSFLKYCLEGELDLIIKFRIKRNYFQDTLRLMRISKSISDMKGVNKAVAVMATDKAKFALEAAELITPEIKKAKENDLAFLKRCRQRSTTYRRKKQRSTVRVY